MRTYSLIIIQAADSVKTYTIIMDYAIVPVWQNCGIDLRQYL